MKKNSSLFKPAALGIPLAIFLIMISWKMVWRGADAPPQSSLPVFGKIPEFSFTDQNNKTLNRKDLQGKVWVADFIFTHCAGVCPLMSGKMQKVQAAVLENPDIRLVSFSVDHDRDNPEVLNVYSKRFKADPAKWFFLTGNKEEIYKLSQQHFHLGVQAVSPEEQQPAGQSVQHSSKFVLVDRAGQIRGYYNGEEMIGVNKLIEDAKTLTKEGK